MKKKHVNKTVCFRAIVPLLLPYPIEHCDKYWKTTEQKILKMSGKVFLPNVNTPVHISQVSPAEFSRLAPKYFQFSHVRKFNLMIFESEVVYIPKDWNFESNYKKLSEGDRYSIFISIVTELLEELVKTIVVAANLARPDSLRVDQSAIFVNGSFYDRADGLFPGWEFEALRFKDHKWPSIQTLEIEETYLWLKSIPDFDRGFSSTSLGRALMCFTHLFGRDIVDEDGPVSDLWSIIGLEALFESNGSRREFTEKLKLLLGEHPQGPKKMKETICELYEIRNRVVHGGGDIPRAFGADKGSRNEECFHKKISNFTGLAGQIFIACLQKLVKKKVGELKFIYKIEYLP